ncbi:exodeoxyribonuclease V subunit alpha [Pseudoalteromonas piratica]|nr:exodeoxyribonuclease V subunit alpha [Pseudoalteromonas piratica]
MRKLLIEHDKIDAFDIQLAEILVPEADSPVFYLVLLLSRAIRAQHSCLPLSSIDRNDPFGLIHTAHGKKETPFSLQDDFTKLLTSHMAVGDNKPLRFYNDNLYFARYDDYEKVFVNAITSRNALETNLDTEQLKNLLARYFEPTNDIDWQKVACAVACLKRFCIISGGPGTGKTTTVTKLLAILQSLYSKVPLKVQLVAPTGKAAARLSESIANAKQFLKIDSQIAKHIPDTAQTLHRLLGVIHLSTKFRHNKQNPLDVDLVILDEASMVDLAMLAKLFDALPDHARVILLGDKDQLSSVDTGNVLSDLCKPLMLGVDHHYTATTAKALAQLFDTSFHAAQESGYLLNDNLAFLQVSHRFKSDSGIGRLAKAVNSNDINALHQVYSANHSDLQFNALEKGFKAFVERAANNYAVYLSAINQGASITEIHNAFSTYQILCATRVGPYGTNELNAKIEKQLINNNLIKRTGAFYIGMPIMVSENNYQLNLFNGDIGIIIQDENGRLMASFIDDQGAERLISTTRLPQFDIVYAMTIHKSQGSEFNDVAMVLPANSPVVNRQLVYTGITRAKSTFELLSLAGGLEKAMAKTVSRYSGLFERFQANNNA